MENGTDNEQLIDDKIAKNIEEIEREKEKKLLTLLAEIIVRITLKEYYETCD